MNYVCILLYLGSACNIFLAMLKSPSMITRKEAGIGAGLVLAGLAVASSWGPRQVGDISPVNCETGPKKGETELVLRKGQELIVGGTKGFLGGGLRSPLELVSEGNGDIGIKDIDQTDGVLLSSMDVVVPSNPDKSIQIVGVRIRNDNSIIFDSNDIDFHIRGSDSDGDTRFNVTATCRE